MNKPKIALVVPGFEHGGGVLSVAKFLYRTIIKSGIFEAKVISLAVSSRDSLGVRISNPLIWAKGVRYENAYYDGIQISRVGAFLIEFEFQRYRRRKVLDRLLEDIDLIQVVCGSPAWANSVLNLGKPVSIQVATLARVERRRRHEIEKGPLGQWRRLMTAITDYYDNRALSKATAIQVENIWMFEYVKSLKRKQNDIDIRLIIPGVDTDIFRPLVNRNISDSPYILCVGRLGDPRKNVDMLLEAFNLVARSIPKVNLITAGQGKPPKGYFERAKELGLITRIFHVEAPSLDELVKLYQNASVFALPSDEEGLGIVILEAFACGIPVVATTCGGPENLIQNGFNGYLVERNDAEEMAQRLIQLLEDRNLNYKIGDQARKMAEEKFSDQVSGQAFIDVWCKILNLDRASLSSI